MKLIPLVLLGTSIFANSTDFSCEQFSYDNEDNYTEESFKDSEREAQIRIAVGEFYQLKDVSEGELESYDELGEGVYATTITLNDGSGKVDVVNVGFGGGNSADYFFKAGTTELLDFASIDGDCIKRGDDPVFPLARTIKKSEIEYKSKSCSVKGETPVKNFSLIYETFEGAMIRDSKDKVVSYNLEGENLSSVLKGQEGSGVSTYSIVENGQKYISLSIENAWNRTPGAALTAKIEVRIKGENYWSGYKEVYKNIELECTDNPYDRVIYYNNVKQYSVLNYDGF